MLNAYSMQKKESTFLKITEDEDDIHTITLAALCGSVALLTAVGFGACLMIVICARCGEEERCLECRVRHYGLWHKICNL